MTTEDLGRDSSAGSDKGHRPPVPAPVLGAPSRPENLSGVACEAHTRRRAALDWNRTELEVKPVPCARRWVEVVNGKRLCRQHAQIERGETPYGPATKRGRGMTPTPDHPVTVNQHSSSRREHILSKDCWCQPEVVSYEATDVALDAERDRRAFWQLQAVDLIDYARALEQEVRRLHGVLPPRRPEIVEPYYTDERLKLLAEELKEQGRRD